MQTALGSIDRRRAAIVTAVVILCVLALWFATRIPRTVTIFVIAGFIASAVHPIVRQLETRRIPRPWGTALVFAVLIVLFAVCIIVLLPLTVAQAQVLLANLPAYLQTAQHWIGSLRGVLLQRYPSIHLPAQFFNVQQFSADRITGIVTAALASLGALAFNVAMALFIAISALILSFFMLVNYRQIAEGFAAVFPTRRRQTALRLASQAVHVFGSYIAGQVIVSAIVGLLITALTAVFGFKFALLIGLISAIAYAVPIVGMLAAHGLGLVIAVPFGVAMIVKVQIILFLVARLGDNVLVPKIMGNSVGVSPIGVMFAVFAGGELFGVPGLILGIPAAALIKLIWGYFIGPWLHAQIEFADLAPPAAVQVTEVSEIAIVSVES